MARKVVLALAFLWLSTSTMFCLTASQEFSPGSATDDATFGIKKTGTKLQARAMVATDGGDVMTGLLNFNSMRLFPVLLRIWFSRLDRVIYYKFHHRHSHKLGEFYPCNFFFSAKHDVTVSSLSNSFFFNSFREGRQTGKSRRIKDDFLCPEYPSPSSASSTFLQVEEMLSSDRVISDWTKDWDVLVCYCPLSISVWKGGEIPSKWCIWSLSSSNYINKCV